MCSRERHVISRIQGKFFEESIVVFGSSLIGDKIHEKMSLSTSAIIFCNVEKREGAKNVYDHEKKNKVKANNTLFDSGLMI